MPDKPRKPFPSFPLTPTPRGWVKKIRGKLYWFGPAHDPDAAMKRYHARAKDLHAGIVAVAAEIVTVKELAVRFLTEKKADAVSGKIRRDGYAKYRRNLRRFLACVGPDLSAADMTPDHFARFRRQVEGKGLDHAVQSVRSWLLTCVDRGWCDAVKFGRDFKKTPARERRARSGVKLFTVEECRAIVVASRGQLRAMVLLALNGGMGQSDVAALPVSAVDLEGGWVDFPRGKTGVARRFGLWPETSEAVWWYVGGKTNDALIFRTQAGLPWVREQPTQSTDPAKSEDVTTVDSVNLEFNKVLARAGVPKAGRSFYTLRRTFRTIADEQGDQRAIAKVMGHLTTDMGGVYVQRITDQRLKAVVDFVRGVIAHGSTPLCSGRPTKRPPPVTTGTAAPPGDCPSVRPPARNPPRRGGGSGTRPAP